MQELVERPVQKLEEGKRGNLTVAIDLLNEAFFEASQSYPGVMSGSTIVLAVLIDLEMYIINLGDSGALVVEGEKY